MGKNIIRKLIAFVLVFVMLFSNNSILNLSIDVQAKVEKVGDNFQLKSNKNLVDDLKIPVIYRNEYYRTRRFIMNCYEGAGKARAPHRVFCGYGAGVSHPNKDNYACYVMSAQEFINSGTAINYHTGKKSGSAGDGTYGRNPKYIAKALYWFFFVENMGDSHDVNKEIAAQSYIWGASQNKNLSTVLKEVGKYKNDVNYSKIKKYWAAIDAVKSGKITGCIQIYDFYKSSAGQSCKSNGLHQPYYRLTEIAPDVEHVTGSKSISVPKELSFKVTKRDEHGVPIPGVKFKITSNKSGYTIPNGGEFTTNANGVAEIKPHKAYTGTIKSGKYKFYYVKNWDLLSDRQKKQQTKAGRYQNKSLAQTALKKKLKTEAAKLAAAAAEAESATWTITEISTPKGYVLANGTKNAGSSKTISTGRRVNIFVESGNTTRVKEDGNVSKITGDFTIKNIVNPKKYGKIIITKKAANNNYTSTYTLNGAKYEVVANFKGKTKEGVDFNSGDVVATVSVNTKNNVTKGETPENLPIGQYTIREKKAPAGFEKSTSSQITPNPVTISDTSGPTVAQIDAKNVTSSETPSVGSLTLEKKYGDSTQSYAEAGATFQLKGVTKLKSGAYFTQQKTTDANGVAKWTDVPYGYYVVTQIGNAVGSNGEGLVPLEPITVLIDANHKNPTLSGKKTLDPIIDCRIRLTKYKETQTGNLTDEKVIEKIREKEQNAVFSIYLGSLSEIRTEERNTGKPLGTDVDENGNEILTVADGDDTITYTYDKTKKVQQLTTDSNGKAESDILETTGNYVIHQHVGPDGYKLCDDKQIYVNTNAVELYSYEMVNPELSEYMQFQKVTQDLNYKGQKLGDPVVEEGAEFYVFDLSKIDKSEFNNFRKLTTEEREAFVENHTDALVPLREGYQYPLVSDDTGMVKAGFEIKYQTPREGFAVVQTKGTEGYYLASPVYSDSFTRRTDASMIYWDKEEAIENPTIVKYAIAKIHKEKIVDAEGNTRPEANAVFHIENAKEEKFYWPPMEEDPAHQITTFKTNENGDAYIPFLYSGSFSLKQDSGAETHKLAEDVDFNVYSEHLTMTEDDMNEFIQSGYDESLLTEQQKEEMIALSEDLMKIVNEPLPAWFNIEKRSTDSQILLNDAEFTLYKIENDERIKIRTGATGMLSNKPENWDSLTEEQREKIRLGQLDFRLEEYGDYVLVEDYAPPGYLLTEFNTGVFSDDPNFTPREIHFTFDADHAHLNNLGTLVYKFDPETARQGNGAGKVVDDKLIVNDKVITGKLGINKFGEVVYGHNQTENSFTFSSDKLAGCRFKLYAEEDIFNDAGQKVFSANQEINPNEHFVTDGRNPLMFYYEDPFTHVVTDEFPMGNYRVVEVSAPDNYTILKDPIHIGLSNESTAERMANAIEEALPEDELSAGDDGTYRYQYFLEPGKRFNAEDNVRIAKKIIFTHIDCPLGNAVDVSAAQDESVVMWNEGTTIYVSSQKENQDIYFNKDCTNMFAGCEQLEEIIFANVETCYMETADSMFYKCPKLTELDLTNFKTPRLQDSTSMFKDCPLLKTIYFGNDKQTFPKEDVATVIGLGVSGPAVLPYYNPNAEENADDSQEDKDAYKFTASTFSFFWNTPTGGEGEANVTDADIESITPNYPYFPNDLSKKSGMLEVTIKLKANSTVGQQQLAYHSKDENPQESLNLKVKIFIVNVDNAAKPLPNENPQAIAEALDALNPPSFRFRKVGYEDRNNDNATSPNATVKTYADAKFQIKVADGVNILDKDGNVIKSGGEIVASNLSTVDPLMDDGDMELDNLLSGYYNTSPKDAPYIFEISEISPPSGLNLSSNPEDNTIKIPNIRFTRQEISNADKQRLLNASTDSIKVSYSFSDSQHLIGVQFANKRQTENMIKKVWTNPTVGGIPETLDINVKEKGTDNIVSTITLTADEYWQQYWNSDELGDIETANTRYDFEEVPQEGFYWEQESVELTPTPDNQFYTLTFKNKVTEIPLQFKKVWDDARNADNKRPTRLRVNLLRDGEPYQSFNLTQNENWETPVIKVPVENPDGGLYLYEWEETAIEPDYGTGFPNENPYIGYKLVGEKTYYDYDKKCRLTIFTNRHETITESSVEKIWDDGEGEFRPAQIYAVLYQTIGQETTKVEQFKYSITNPSGGTSIFQTSLGRILLNQNNQWKAKAIELPAFTSDGTEIKYSWKEEKFQPSDMPDYEVPEYETVTYQ